MHAVEIKWPVYRSILLCDYTALFLYMFEIYQNKKLNQMCKAPPPTPDSQLKSSTNQGKQKNRKGRMLSKSDNGRHPQGIPITGENMSTGFLCGTRRALWYRTWVYQAGRGRAAGRWPPWTKQRGLGSAAPAPGETMRAQWPAGGIGLSS